MKTFKIVLEIQLKDASILINDFVYDIIEQGLEAGEDILDYELEEITE